MKFICTIVALKARDNHISNQSLSETAQNLARSFENNFLAHSVIPVPDYMIKKYITSVYSPIPITSKSVGKRVYSVIHNVLKCCVSARKFVSFMVLTSNSLLQTVTD